MFSYFKEEVSEIMKKVQKELIVELSKNKFL